MFLVHSLYAQGNNYDGYTYIQSHCIHLVTVDWCTTQLVLFGVLPKDHPAVLWVLGIVKSSVGRRLAVPGVVSPLCYIDCLCPPPATANHAHRHYIIVSMHVIGSTVSIEEWMVYFMTFLVSLIATCLVCHLDCYFCTPSHLLSLSDMIHSLPSRGVCY